MADKRYQGGWDPSYRNFEEDDYEESSSDSGIDLGSDYGFYICGGLGALIGAFATPRIAQYFQGPGRTLTRIDAVCEPIVGLMFGAALGVVAYCGVSLALSTYMERLERRKQKE